MPLSGEYELSPQAVVRGQVETYERTGDRSSTESRASSKVSSGTPDRSSLAPQTTLGWTRDQLGDCQQQLHISG